MDASHSNAPLAAVQAHDRRTSPRWAASSPPAATGAHIASAEVARYRTTAGARLQQATAQRSPASPSSSAASPATTRSPRLPASTVSTAAPVSPGHSRSAST
jgi:hypothetical protein